MARWLGVDVGVRKGLDVALVDERRVVALERRLGPAEVVGLVERHAPLCIGVDSPIAFAAPGQTARPCELALRRAICAIRWTPDEPTVRANPHYAWILAGRALYDALDAAGFAAVEVFPTASWTRWYGPRGGRSRAAWSTEALAALGLGGVPAHTNQDQRDAIAAAVTVREHSASRTESFGEIVVPRARAGARRPAP